jgi:hypothetical protein
LPYSPVKFVEMTDTGMATTRMPDSDASAAMKRPAGVTGKTSPYPTVVIVTMHHQKAAGMDWKGEGTGPARAPAGSAGRIHAPSASLHSPRSA